MSFFHEKKGNKKVMLNDKLPLEKIKKYTGLSLDEIKAIQL